MPRNNTKEKPQRSCLCCREPSDKDKLLRFVLSPQGEVLPDLDAKLPGRGAYTCVSSECLAKTIKQRGFNRAFKTEVSVLAAEDMVTMVAGLMRERIIGYIGLANKAGKVISGGTMVSEAIRGKIKPGLILVSTDVSEAIGEKIVVLAEVNRIRCERIMSKDDFGAILGKAPRSAVAVKHGGFVERLVWEIERYRNFLVEVRGL
jgi:uncharacterized protein